MRPRDENRLGRRERQAGRREARALARQAPLLPQLPQATRILLGLGLLGLCLWLPSFVALFRP